MIALIWSLITSRFGGWIIGGLAVAAVLVVFKWERAGKLKAQADLATTIKGYKILDQGYLKLYQEREQIKMQMNQQRGKINELRQKNDLDGLADQFNNPGGMRRPVQSNPQGGAKAAPSRYRATGTGEEYQEAP
jgi:hypothetical protein